jgi:hypothetical protein
MRSSLYGGLAVAAVLTVGLVLAACGSSNNNSTSTTAALTKPQFLKQGNAICKKGSQQINKAGQKIFGTRKQHKKPSKADMTKFATQVLIPNIQSQINGIKALGAPKGDEAKVNAIVTSAQGALDLAKKDPTVLVQNGPGPFKATNKLANAYGLTVCGSGGGGGGNGGGGNG